MAGHIDKIGARRGWPARGGTGSGRPARALAAAGALALAATLWGCGVGDDLGRVEQALGIDLPAGALVTQVDTHADGGDGRGVAVYEVAFFDARARELLAQARASVEEGDGTWHSLPLPEALDNLVYGSSFSAGAPARDDDALPRVGSGYYLYLDRSTQTDGDTRALATAGSSDATLRYTLALLDADTGRLHVLVLDA